MNLYITHWHWRCGDGCCSDSGVDVECGNFGRDNLNDFQEGYFPAFLASDILWTLSTQKDCQSHREKFCAAVNEWYNGTDWCWTRYLQPLSDEKLKASFKAFGHEVEIFWNDEER